MHVRAPSLLAVLAFAACSRTSTAPAPSPSPSTSTFEHVPLLHGKAFGEACVADQECAAAVCFHKRLKGPDAGRETRDAGTEPVEHDGYCSMSCNTDADCPVPPTRGRCGARGMCKRPE